jgi:hypothetical protein
MKMNSLVRRQGATFVVDFGKIEIPSIQAKELELAMQEAALGVIARIDFRGRLPIGRLPPGTYGMIFGDWPPVGFPGFPGEPEGPDLDAGDHTRIIDAVMRNGVALIRVLARELKSKGRVPGEKVLRALLALPSLDGRTKQAVSTVLDNASDLDEAASSLTRSRGPISDLRRRIDASDSVEQLLDVLQESEFDDAYRKTTGLPEAIRLTRQILEDGLTSIYSTDHPFYDGLGGGGTTTVAKEKEKGASDIGKEDVKGGITGALGGAVGGPKGAAIGAVGGAALASAAEAIGQLWDSIFG